MEENTFLLAQQSVGESADNPTELNTQAAPQGSSAWLLPMLIGGVVLIYFVSNFFQRKEEKKKKTMLNALQKGDSIVTSSGIVGTIASIKEKTILINVGDGTRIEFLRSAISQLRGDSAASKDLVNKASKAKKT